MEKQELLLKSKLIIATVLIFVAISVAFGIAKFLNNDQSPEPIQTTPILNSTGEAVIETDKTEYEKHETIKIEFRNNSDKEIYLSSASFDIFEYEKNNEWNVLGGSPDRGVSSYVSMKMYPGEKYAQEIIPYWIWNLNLQEGYYRISGIIYFECKKVGYPNSPIECAGKTTVYSNTFLIKEEKDFSYCDTDCKEMGYLGGFCKSGAGKIINCQKNGISVNQSKECEATGETSETWRTCCCQRETIEDLTIQTDKIKYAKEEMIGIEIKNRSYTVYNITLPFEVERKYKKGENINWEVIPKDPSLCPGSRLRIVHSYQELPGDKAVVNTQWDQKEYDCGEKNNLNVQSQEGTYRIKILLTPKKEKANAKTDSFNLYSNEFIIRNDENVMVDFYSCTESSDCLKVRGDVCGCNGRGMASAINKKFEQEWKDKLKAEWQKDSITCLPIISSHPSCFKRAECIENNCVLNSQVTNK